MQHGPRGRRPRCPGTCRPRGSAARRCGDPSQPTWRPSRPCAGPQRTRKKSAENPHPAPHTAPGSPRLALQCGPSPGKQSALRGGGTHRAAGREGAGRATRSSRLHLRALGVRSTLRLSQVGCDAELTARRCCGPSPQPRLLLEGTLQRQSWLRFERRVWGGAAGRCCQCCAVCEAGALRGTPAPWGCGHPGPSWSHNCPRMRACASLEPAPSPPARRHHQQDQLVAAPWAQADPVQLRQQPCALRSRAASLWCLRLGASDRRTPGSLS